MLKKGLLAAWGLGFLLLTIPSGYAKSDPYAKLESIAENSLTQNIVNTPSGSYLRAGAHQFQSLWTRDFSFGSRGLYSIGRSDVVRDQLSLILKNLRDDGLTGKYFDSLNILARYISVYFRFSLPMQGTLKPNYEAGIPKSASMDGNSLVLLTALQYLRETGDQAWWDAHEKELIAVYRYYDSKKEDGLLVQNAFEDWQDTVARAGKTFYVNLLYYAASERLQAFPHFGVQPPEIAELKRKIIATFFDPEADVFRSLENQPFVSLEGNLLAIDLGFFPERSLDAEKLYRGLKQSSLFTRNDGTPGACSTPDYPVDLVGREPRLVGIQHYHDEMYWSWLMALSAKVALEMGDRALSHKMFSLLQQMAERDGTLSEVYEPHPPFAPWNTPLYKSESPFSWGTGMVLDALRFLHTLE
jgi:glycogen debranching enzyme